MTGAASITINLVVAASLHVQSTLNNGVLTVDAMGNTPYRIILIENGEPRTIAENKMWNTHLELPVTGYDPRVILEAY